MKNTIIRGMPALLLVFGLVMAACSPLSGGGALPPGWDQEPPTQEYVTLNLTIGEADAARDLRIEMTRPRLAASNSRAARVAVGEYAYQMYLEDVLIQTGFVTVTDADAADAGQEYEFIPATTARPAGDAEKSFKLYVVLGETDSETVITRADEELIEVTEERQEDGTFTLDILIAAGIIPDNVMTLEAASDVVEEALDGEVEDSSGGISEENPEPPAPAVTSTIVPALKSKLQGTWILRDPDNHKNEQLQGMSYAYFQAGIPGQPAPQYALKREVTEAKVVIATTSYTGSQQIVPHVWLDTNWSNHQNDWDAWYNPLVAAKSAPNNYSGATAEDAQSYQETGTVAYKIENGKNIVTITGRTPPAGIPLTGNETVIFEVKFLSDTVIQLVGSDAETLYITGNTWDKQQ